MAAKLVVGPSQTHLVGGWVGGWVHGWMDGWMDGWDSVFLIVHLLKNKYAFGFTGVTLTSVYV
jgi:hypothetical protein